MLPVRFDRRARAVHDERIGLGIEDVIPDRKTAGVFDVEIGAHVSSFGVGLARLGGAVMQCVYAQSQAKSLFLF